MQTMLRFFVPCLFSLALFLLTGCGSKDMTTDGTITLPVLTVAEQAEVDRYIANHGRNAILHYLIHHLEVETRQRVEAEEEPDEELAFKYLKYLIFQGANVNAKDTTGTSGGFTPLHLAIMGFKSGRITELLLSNGANVNAKCDRGVTPLHVAAGFGRIEVAQYLVSQGANVNAKDTRGHTPLCVARIDEHLEGNAKIAQLLVSSGAIDYTAIAHIQISKLLEALQRYNADHQGYPVTEQGLHALIFHSRQHEASSRSANT